MNVKLMVSKHCYPIKPEGLQVGSIRNDMRPVLIDERGLFDALSKGRAWMPSYMEGRHIRDNWISQQAIGLDFDGKVKKISPKAVIKRLSSVDIHPAIIHDTYSSTEENRRYRLVLFLDEECEDPDVMEMALHRLAQFFPESDQSCKDLSRMFFGAPSFGSIEPLYNSVDYERCDIRKILSLDVPDSEPSEDKKRTSWRASVSSERIESLNRNFDLLEAVRLATGEQGRDRKEYISFHKCPICGHHDCFVYYPHNNTWTCFSSSNDTGFKGGDAISFLMASRKLSFPEAVKMVENT